MHDGVIERFGKYELIEKIAAGGMAEVFRARSRGAAGFEKIMVIKKILPKLAEDQEFQTLFLDEARIAVQLMDVNIVQVYDLGAIDGQYFMAMEYVDGIDLSKLMQKTRKLKGSFPIHLALFIISEVLKALNFAHNQKDATGKGLNIVHCDISPQNILISRSGEVKLTDFGISRAAFQMEEQHQVIRGKYAYMAPEQVEGRVLTGQTDIFALSIVLWELLAGKRLFKSKEKAQTLNNVRKAIVPSLHKERTEISPDLETVVAKGLKKSLKERYSNALRMLEELSAVMSQEGYRATNNDLAQFMRELDEMGASGTIIQQGSAQPVLPQIIVVVALEIIKPPKTLASPRLSTLEVIKTSKQLIEKHKGEVWERNDGSLIAVWVAQESLEHTCRKAMQTAFAIRKYARQSDYRVSAGIAPGVVRIGAQNRPPVGDWQLAGPFYLTRWMMNLSAHRGKILMTKVVSKCLKNPPQPLGRIQVQANSSIFLYER